MVIDVPDANPICLAFLIVKVIIIANRCSKCEPILEETREKL